MMIDFSDYTVLFKEIQKGNTRAFEYLYKRYYSRLKGFAIGFVSDSDMADDIIQECFLSLWEKKHKLAATSLSSLMFTMVRNCCLNHLKHASVKNRHIVGDCSLSEVEERLYYADFGLDASQKLLYEELNGQLADAMLQLPERCKEVFILSRHEGLKNREIAEKLKISTTAVEKHIGKALSVFSFHLREKYPVDYTFLLILLSGISAF